MKLIDRLKSPWGLHVASFTLETFYQRRPQSKSGYDLLSLGSPIVKSEHTVHINGLDKNKILTVVLPELLRHSLLQLPINEPPAGVPTE